MSKPKRRTLRRLKRVLGVTAIILAILIAAIPDLGEARSYGDFECNIMPGSVNQYTKDSETKALSFDLDDFSVTKADNTRINSSEYRMTISEEGHAKPIPVASWFYNYAYEYTIRVEKFDKTAFETDDANARRQAEEDTTGTVIYDAIKPDKNAAIYWKDNIDEELRYEITFYYENFYGLPATTFFPSVYYYGKDTWSDVSTAAINNFTSKGDVEWQKLMQNGFTYQNNNALYFTATLSGVGMSCPIYVLLNTADPIQTTLKLDPTSTRKFDAGGGNRVFFSGSEGTTADTSEFSMPSDERITFSDGLKSMYLPAEDIYLTTEDMAYTTAASIGIDRAGSTVEVIDAFQVRLKNGDGIYAENQFSNAELEKFHNYHLNFALPIDGTGLASDPYSKFRINEDTVCLYYKSRLDSKWYPVTETTRPSNDGEVMTLSVDYKPYMSHFAILFDRAVSMNVTDLRGGTNYQNLISAHPVTGISPDLTETWYVNLKDHDAGQKYNDIVAATAAQNPIYNLNDSYNNAVEIINIVTNKTNTYSDGSYKEGGVYKFPAYNLTIRVNSDWSSSGEVVLYYKDKNASGTPTYKDAAYWTNTPLTENIDSNYGPYVSFRVDPAYGEEYVLYYHVLKETVERGDLTGSDDIRDPENLTGGENFGFQANKVAGSGNIYGGEFIMVVDDKTSDLWIDDSADEVSAYSTENHHYNIYFTKRGDEKTDYRSEVTMDPGTKIQVTLPLPKTWTVQRNTVQLVLGHKDDPNQAEADITYNYDYSVVTGNKIQFTSSKFSEYAVYYHDPATERSENERSRMSVDGTGSFINGLGTPDAWTSRLLGNTSWQILLQNPNTSDTLVSDVKAYVISEDSTKYNYESTRWYPFYIDLQTSTDNGVTWSTVDREQASTVLGNDTITVYIPAPTDISGNYANNGTLRVFGYDPDGPNKLRKLTTTDPAPIENGSSGVKYISFVLEGNLGDISMYNPYMLAYTPSGGSDTPTPSPTDKLRLVDDACTLTEASASLANDVEGRSWVLVIKDSTDTNTINNKISDYDELYAPDTVEKYVYDMRLYYDRGVGVSPTTPVSLTEYANTAISVTLPFPKKMRDSYQEGDSVAFFALNSNNILKPFNNGSGNNNNILVIDGTNKTITVTTDELTSLNPYALVHIPQKKVDPDAGQFEVIDWPSSVAMPDNNLTSGADFMMLSETLPKAVPSKPDEMQDYENWKLLVSQYDDSQALKTAIGTQITNHPTETGYIAKKKTTKDGSKKTVQDKSVVKAYNIELWEYDKDTKKYTQKVSNDIFDKMGEKGVTITLPLNGALIGSNGTAQIWTLSENGTLERLTGSIAISGATPETSFTAYHFSQFAIVYTPAAVTTDTSSNSNNGSSSNSNNSSSNNGSSNNSSSNSSTASSSSSNASSASSGSSSTGGGGGNRASGDPTYNGTGKANTADATTYKAIFILILLAFGAFELVSSMPAKRKARPKE